MRKTERERDRDIASTGALGVGRAAGRCVCDGWSGQARPQIRVQTNSVINEPARAAVLRLAPHAVMHAEGSRRQFVMEK